MTRKRFILSILRLTVLSVLLFSTGFSGKAQADEALLKIEGVPLEIHAYEDSTMGVFRWQGEALVRQYYAQYSKGSLLFLNGQDESLRWGGQYFGVAGFTPVSHAKPNDWTMETVYDAGTSGVRITQTVSYVNGSSYYQIVWKIANTGQTTYTDVRFIHMGDTYFAGDDSSEGHWNEELGMVYLTNPDPALTGIMGFYGGLGSRADRYVEDNYSTARAHAVSGYLPNTVRADYHDAGYALQWNRNVLAPGQVWNVTAFEKWTESGYIQVIAPASSPIVPDQMISLNFQIQNYQAVADTFDLTLSSAAGWPLSLPEGNTVTVPANSLVGVEARVTSPPDAADESADTITLRAVSQTDPEISNSDAVAVVVQSSFVNDATTQPVPPGTRVSDYRMLSFVHYPLNPDAVQVIGVPENPSDFRMGTYDPGTGGYIEYGDDLDIIPGKAYWTLARQGFTVSFTGREVPLNQDFEHELTYNSATGNGWNQIGCPNEAAYNWEEVSVIVYDDEGEIVFGPARLAEITDPNDYIDPRLWRWENGAYFDDTALMQPYNGYWTKTRHENVFLIFPVDAQTDPEALITRIHTFWKEKVLLAKKWVSPRIAVADVSDSPPMPMASLQGNNAEASSGGGCFIDLVGQKF